MAHVSKLQMSSWMVANLLLTDVFHLLDGPWIHVNTMGGYMSTGRIH